MGRLIDADKLYEDLANNLSSIMGDGSDGEAIDIYVTIGDIIHDTFNAQPTAYDPDKVVEQLEDRKSLMLETFKISESDIDRGRIYGMDKAIEIVKAGGTDDIDTCAWMKGQGRMEKIHIVEKHEDRLVRDFMKKSRV